MTNLLKKMGWVVVMIFITNTLMSQWSPLCPNDNADCKKCFMNISVENDIPDVNSGFVGGHFTGDINAVDCADCMDHNSPAHHCFKFSFNNTTANLYYGVMHVGQGNSCEGNLDGVYTINEDVCTATAIHPGSQTIIYPVFPPNAMTSVYLCVNSHAQVSLCDVFKSASPLSVDMAGMDVKPLHSTNMIMWTTLSEWGNNYFDVEKSHDGVKWTAFARHFSVKNESASKSYTAIDYQPYQMTYYRIKSVDFEGGYTYSRAMSLQREFSELVSIFPNPAGNELSFAVNKYDHGLITVTFTDISGNSIISRSFTNDDVHSIDISALPTGVYLIQVSGKDINFAKKIVKMEPE